MIPATLNARERQYALAICCLSVLMISLDTTVLNVALPRLQHDLHTSISGAQWTLDSYTLVVASLLTLAGSTADRIGRRKTFQTGLTIFVIGSVACSLAPSLGFLVAFRIVQAIGGSMLNPVAMSIISNLFTDSSARARAIGVWSGTVGISMAAGPIVGGALVDGIGWRSIFWMNAPIGIAAIYFSAKYIPESKADRPRRPDPQAQVGIIAFLVLLVYGIIEAPRRGWGSPLIIGCFAAAAVVFVLLIRHEHRRDEPVIDPRFFRSAPFSGAAAVAVMTFFTLGGFLFLNTLYLQDARHETPLRAGISLIPMAAGMLVSGPVAGRLVARIGARPVMIGGAIFLTVAAGTLALAHGHPVGVGLESGYTLIGLAIGSLNSGITNTALSGMPRSQSGVAAAILSTGRQVGVSFGVAILGSVLASHVVRVAATPAFYSAAATCWWILAAAGVLTFIIVTATTGSWGQRSAARAATSFEEHAISAPAPSAPEIA